MISFLDETENALKRQPIKIYMYIHTYVSVHKRRKFQFYQDFKAVDKMRKRPYESRLKIHTCKHVYILPLFKN